MVATPLRWAYFALPAPAKRAVRAARQRVHWPRLSFIRSTRHYSEEELCRFAEVMLRSGSFR